MVSNAELEMRWIDAWNDLYDLIGDRSCAHNIRCLLPHGRVVDVEECEGWLQDSAYEDWFIKVSSGWVLGTKGVIAFRWRSC